jgi:hypothetical protein
MGLDNSIYLKTSPNEEIHFPSFLEPYDDEDGFEICYWRKCWNIREAIINCTKEGQKYHGDGGVFDLTIKDLEAISVELYKFLLAGEDNWNDSEQSIWEFERMLPHLARDIAAIGWLIEYLKKHPTTAYAYFLDSY